MNKFENETTIESEFGAMLSLAKAYFENYNQKRHEYHQCLVLSTAKGELLTYSITSDSVGTLKNQECSIASNLEKSQKNIIKKIVCMWEGNTIDIPAFQFLKKLCEINIENKKAEILLSAGTNAYVTKKIVDIIG